MADRFPYKGAWIDPASQGWVFRALFRVFNWLHRVLHGMVKRRVAADPQLDRWVTASTPGPVPFYPSMAKGAPVEFSGPLSSIMEKQRRPARPARGVVLPADQEEAVHSTLATMARGMAQKTRAGHYAHSRFRSRLEGTDEQRVIEAEEPQL